MAKRFPLILLAVVLAIGLILGGCAKPAPTPTPTPTPTPAPAEREVIKLRAISAFPMTNVDNLIMQELFCEEVSKQVLEATKDYKVEWEYLGGGAVCKPAEVIDTLASGLGDVGTTITVFYLKSLQLQQFTSCTPFGPADAATMYRAMYKTIDEYPIHDELLEKEHNQIAIAWLAKGCYQLITDFPIHTMEDMEGHKMAHGGPMIPWLTALGSVGVASTFLEAYTSLETGVYDGWSAFPEGIAAFKMYEPAPYYTEVDFGTPAMALISMNLDTFNGLPAEVQEVVLKVREECRMEAAEYMTKVEKDAIEVMKKEGTAIYVLPQDERVRWAKILDEAGIAKKFCEEADAAGLPGTEIMRAYIRNCEAEGHQWPVVPTID